VTLANNHALDYGYDALLDTFDYLDDARIAWVGAGPDLGRARAHATLEAGEARLAVLGVTDHPAGFAARRDRPGVALADLSRGVPSWLTGAVVAAEADAVLVTPHWGPNMPEPVDVDRDRRGGSAAWLQRRPAVVTRRATAAAYRERLEEEELPRFRGVWSDVGLPWRRLASAPETEP
jgi:hypothetical protein